MFEPDFFRYRIELYVLEDASLDTWHLKFVEKLFKIYT